MTRSAEPRRGERPARPIERAEVAAVLVLALVGLAWGAGWQRSAALTDIASVAPILMVVIGPGALITYLAYRFATGKLEMRMDGYGSVVLVVAAIVGNVLAPGLSPAVDVPGHLSGTLAGATIDDAAGTTCTWGPGRSAVIRLTYDRHSLTLGVPPGLLVIELPSGAVYVDASQSGGATVPLRLGSGGIGQGASGSITLNQNDGALVDGQLSWTCDAPPAS